jgi:hypothetical protein
MSESKKDRVIRLVLQILDEVRGGMRFAGLTREVMERDPLIGLETVRYHVYQLPDYRPDLVYRPSRGLYRLCKYRDDEGHDRELAEEPKPPTQPGGGQFAYIYDRQGRAVAVVLSIEEWEDLRRLAHGRMVYGAVTHASSSSSAERIADYLRSLEGFTFVTPAPPRGHMGATIIDCLLQRGVNYDSVVLPRVEGLAADHPEAATTSGFSDLMGRIDLATLIDFRGEYALGPVRELTALLVANGIESEEELRLWLEDADNRVALSRLSGIGLKTGEFIRLRCGAPDAIAIDRWILRLFESAHVDTRGYWQQHAVLTETAELLGVTPAVLEESVWSFFRRHGK